MSITKMLRGSKLFIGEDENVESHVNTYLSCRDGVVTCYEYVDGSGYGVHTRLFYCRDTKHEAVCIIRQVKLSSHVTKKSYWQEEVMDFDSDSFEFLVGLINGKSNILGGKYTVVRDYMERED